MSTKSVRLTIAFLLIYVLYHFIVNGLRCFLHANDPVCKPDNNTLMTYSLPFYVTMSMEIHIMSTRSVSLTIALLLT